MSLLQKFETNSYCFGGRHYSGTNNIRGFIGEPGLLPRITTKSTRITTKSTKMLKGNCVTVRKYVNDCQ